MKHIITSILFVFISIYVAFLNPHESTFHLTQSQTFTLPTVVLLLAAVFTGVLFSVTIFWTSNIKNSFSRWKSNLQKSRSEKKRNKIEALFKNAENFFHSGRLEKALSLVDKVIDAAPDHVRALGLKGKILCSQGKKNLAANFQQKALQKDPQNLSVLLDLVETYSQADQTEDEINLLKKIHRENPKAVQPLVQLRDAFLKQEDWKSVLTAQDKILPLVRENKQRWNEELKNKSRFLLARGKQSWDEEKRDPAISDFKQSIKAWSKNSEAHLHLGDAYLAMGKPKVALKKWFTGFEESQDIACLTRAQKVYNGTEDPQALIEIYQKAINSKEQQENYKFVLMLAILYLEHDQAENAKSVLEENEMGNDLLGNLLLQCATRPSNNGADLELNLDQIKEAVLRLHKSPTSSTPA
ncbi:MAG: tetratricopeptide repeat protein [Nitrospinota bacterium]